MDVPHLPPPAELLEGAALFLDFDGTLVELADAPDEISIPGDLHPLLERLVERLGGRVAIVSGRSIADLERHLGSVQLALSGSHGLELRFPDGTGIAVSAPGELADAQRQIAAFAAERDGLLVEEKPAGIALHYRQAPREAGKVAALMEGLADELGLEVQHGKMVAELRPGGADKGDALRALMREPPFTGARPVFVGDDLTDEHAFGAAAELGGAGILVGPPRPSTARWRLDDVAAVAAWLRNAAEGPHG